MQVPTNDIFLVADDPPTIFLSSAVRDLTWNSFPAVPKIAMRVSGILPAIHEEEISPEQMGNYKVELHRLFLGWANKIARNSTYEIEKGAPAADQSTKVVSSVSDVITYLCFSRNLTARIG